MTKVQWLRRLHVFQKLDVSTSSLQDVHHEGRTSPPRRSNESIRRSNESIPKSSNWSEHRTNRWETSKKSIRRSSNRSERRRIDQKHSTNRSERRRINRNVVQSIRNSNRIDEKRRENNPDVVESSRTSSNRSKTSKKSIRWSSNRPERRRIIPNVVESSRTSSNRSKTSKKSIGCSSNQSERRRIDQKHSTNRSERRKNHSKRRPIDPKRRMNRARRLNELIEWVRFTEIRVQIPWRWILQWSPPTVQFNESVRSKFKQQIDCLKAILTKGLTVHSGRRLYSIIGSRQCSDVIHVKVRDQPWNKR